MQAPILMETLMGQGFAGGLLCCVACEGNSHSTTPHALHPTPQSRCRGHVDLFRASQAVLVVYFWMLFGLLIVASAEYLF